METKSLTYETPETNVVEIMPEGVFCASPGGGSYDDLLNGGPLN